jgi:hypothetical protein
VVLNGYFAPSLILGVKLYNGNTLVRDVSASAPNFQVTMNGVAGVSSYKICLSNLPSALVPDGSTYSCTDVNLANPCGPNTVTLTFSQTQQARTQNAYTIGKWKEWASCSKSNGKQAYLMDSVVIAAGGFSIGNSAISGAGSGGKSADCDKVLLFLTKGTTGGGKDGVWNAVAQLTSAKLNVLNGACLTSDIQSLIAETDQILKAINFDGNTYNTPTSAQSARLGQLNTALDGYNSSAC